MVKERMLELLLLDRLESDLADFSEDSFKFRGKTYNIDAIKSKCAALWEEFIEPYIIDSTSRDD